jgi:hypothetical protein
MKQRYCFLWGGHVAFGWLDEVFHVILVILFVEESFQCEAQIPYWAGIRLYQCRSGGAWPVRRECVNYVTLICFCVTLFRIKGFNFGL